MVRSAAALVAVLILAGFTAFQQVATHTVVRGDTLWGLAQHYYQNPFDWRRIWEANREQISDPNLILPGWVLTIPGRDAAAEGAPAPGPAAAPVGVEPPGGQRTIFFQDSIGGVGGVVGPDRGAFLAVPRDLVTSAPWLAPLGQEPWNLGKLDGFAGGTSLSRTVRGWDRVHLTFTGEPPPVGTEVLTFRVTRTIDRVGQVATPTGVVTLSEVEGNEAVAIVTREYDRIVIGDLLAPLPTSPLRPGQHAQPVVGGGEAMVMGFAGLAELRDVGAVAFLDQGSDHGVAIGDEYEYVNRLAGSDVVEGRVQVVGVSPQTSAARITYISDAVFRPGLVVRLSRKMR